MSTVQLSLESYHSEQFAATQKVEIKDTYRAFKALRINIRLTGPAQQVFEWGGGGGGLKDKEVKMSQPGCPGRCYPGKF